MTYKVQAGIPIMKRIFSFNKQRPRLPNPFPVTNMKIGDSFFINGSIVAKDILPRLTYFVNRDTSFRMKTRTVRCQNQTGVRVWRIA